LNKEYSGSNKLLLREMKGMKFTPFKEAVKGLFAYYRGGLDGLDKKAVLKDEYIKYCRKSC
jgi:hypothetical protein